MNAPLVHAEREGGQVEHGSGDAEGAGSADQVTEDLFHFGAAPGLQVPVQRGGHRRSRVGEEPDEGVPVGWRERMPRGGGD